MKKIIAKHNVDVFQICKCFRNGESSGFLHSSEFTMLEYYSMSKDYMDSLSLTEDLFDFLTTKQHEVTKTANQLTPFKRITVAEAFASYAGFDLFSAAAQGVASMETQAHRLGLDPMPGMTVAQLYDLIFIHSVEPQLKMDKAVAILDYPAFVPCLAKKSQNKNTVERWELYYNGIELANCYTEERDPQIVKDFFISEESLKKQSSLVQHKTDHEYWKIFDNGNFPPCSGVAMGLDRLIMALTGRSTIDSVLPFAI